MSSRRKKKSRDATGEFDLKKSWAIRILSGICVLVIVLVLLDRGWRLTSLHIWGMNLVSPAAEKLSLDLNMGYHTRSESIRAGTSYAPKPILSVTNTGDKDVFVKEADLLCDEMLIEKINPQSLRIRPGESRDDILDPQIESHHKEASADDSRKPRVKGHFEEAFLSGSISPSRSFWRKCAGKKAVSIVTVDGNRFSAILELKESRHDESEE